MTGLALLLAYFHVLAVVEINVVRQVVTFTHSIGRAPSGTIFIIVRL